MIREQAAGTYPGLLGPFRADAIMPVTSDRSPRQAKAGVILDDLVANRQPAPPRVPPGIRLTAGFRLERYPFGECEVPDHKISYSLQQTNRLEYVAVGRQVALGCAIVDLNARFGG